MTTNQVIDKALSKIYRHERVKKLSELQKPLKMAIVQKWNDEYTEKIFMKTASAHNAPLTGEIKISDDIVYDFEKSKAMILAGIPPPIKKEFPMGEVQRMRWDMENKLHSLIFSALWRKPQIQSVGRGNCSQEAI